MLLNKYIQYIGNQKRYSVHSLAAYQNDLMQYHAYIKLNYSDIDVVASNYHMIRSWLVDLVNNHYSSTSVNRKLSAVKSFYKYLVTQKHIEVNPAYNITALKSPKRLPTFIEKDRMLLLCDELGHEPIPSGFQQKRNQLIIELFYQTGIRLNELINIKRRDIDFGRQEIKIHGKRNKDRMLPITQSLVVLINEYVEAVGHALDFLPDYLLLTDKGEKLYPKFAYRIVNFYLEKTTSLKKRSPHVLRHTFATHLLNNGADLNAIKELLGHANLSSTQVYTHNTITQLTNVYKQAHPRA